MKKTIFILGASLITSTILFSCSKESVKETPKNYYGVEPVNNGTPKEAYYAFFVGIVLIGFIILWLLKKMGKK